MADGGGTRSQLVDLGGPVHYLDFGGAGPAAVLVHGLGGSADSWLAVGPPLAERARVLAVDLAGFGRTPPAGRSSGVHANRRLLDRFLSEVVGGPALLVGNSMGGTIALLEAAARPERVAGLVLVDPSLPRPRQVRIDPEVRAVFTAYAIPLLGERFLARRRAQVGPEGLVRDVLRVCCVDPTLVSGDVLEALDALARERAGLPWADAAFLRAARSLLALLARPGRYRRLIQAVTAPTLLVQGDADRLAPVGSAMAVARAKPDWTLEVLEGVGHVPQLEVPDRFVEVVGRWLDGPGHAAVSAA
jgi:pimeloyl-ACP methyl ester carboxylesterase